MRFVFYSFVILLVSCSQQKSETQKKQELIIFHAGSVTVPVKEIVSSFNKLHPNITVKTEIAGSVECARKIRDLKKNCDIFISADYKVIEKILYPTDAQWLIKFATNEMVLAFNNKSKFSDIINADNWTKIIQKQGVEVGRSDPDSDPCGYRTVHVLKLAEKRYQIQQFAQSIINDSKGNVRPKEMDLLALLETNNIDYLFIYKSVAIQHTLDFVELGDCCNLSNPAFNEEYAKVSVNLKGKKPGDYINQLGESIVYGVTMPSNGENREEAILFLDFLLDSNNGLKIFDNQGQKPIIKPTTDHISRVPQEIKDRIENE